MNDKNKGENFLNYLNKPISKESINILYTSNNISFDKCELYNDFIQSLLLLVFDTYMGDEFTNLEQQIKHFKWCWDKNISNFKKEGINFKNKDSYIYFLEFIIEVYYLVEDKKEPENIDTKILSLWKKIFDYSGNKTNSDIDIFLEIYGILEESLKTT